jgi:hypothetical protein
MLIISEIIIVHDIYLGMIRFIKVLFHSQNVFMVLVP